VFRWRRSPFFFFLKYWRAVLPLTLETVCPSFISLMFFGYPMGRWLCAVFLLLYNPLPDIFSPPPMELRYNLLCFFFSRRDIFALATSALLFCACPELGRGDGWTFPSVLLPGYCVLILTHVPLWFMFRILQSYFVAFFLTILFAAMRLYVGCPSRRLWARRCFFFPYFLGPDPR